jgi:ABC-type uncharacterized transport system permease subunit
VLALTDRQYFLVAVLLYGVSALYSIFLFRRGFRKDDRINYCLLLVAFLFHTAAMFQRGFSLSRCPIHNLYEATLFMAWTMVATYLVLGLWCRLRFLGAFAAPVVLALGVFALMPDLDTPERHFEFEHWWVSLHVALFALAYGAFGLSSVAGVMFLSQERNLKFHKLRAVLSLLPPIQRLERVAGGLLLGGFGLLSIGLAFSLAGLWHLKGRLVAPDPKIVWAFFVWFLYLTLVVLRWRYAQGGRRFAWGTIAGFVFVLLTFWGSSFWSPLHHPTP